MNIEQAVELLRAFDKYPQRIPAPQPGFVYELTPTPDWAIFQAEMLLRELSANEEVMERVVEFKILENKSGFTEVYVWLKDGDKYRQRWVRPSPVCAVGMIRFTPLQILTKALSAGMTCKQIMGEG